MEVYNKRIPLENKKPQEFIRNVTNSSNKTKNTNPIPPNTKLNKHSLSENESKS